MIEPLLLTAPRVTTYAGAALLTNASGFFFEREGRLYLVTSRHVVSDPDTGHQPDRLEVEVHSDAANLAQAVSVPVPLYDGTGEALWRSATDSAGAVDVAVLPLDRGALPAAGAWRAFTPAHIHDPSEPLELGRPLLVVGFPLGFHDHLHHLPVARHAILASSFAFRFQGMGYFLTDGRTHRGTSGAAVVTRLERPAAALGDLPWALLGVHSARLDMGTRDLQLDEALGLNCTWYADILMTLTED